MKGIFTGQTLLSKKKSVIYMIKVNYSLYNYTPCNSTWMCLLELHKKRVHRGTLPKQHSRKTYECPTCKKTFTSGNNLDEHIKVKHENNTPEQCDECNRAFGTPHALKAHKYNMHKRSKCEICGQSLCNTFWLKRHMSASHGIMPEGSIPCSHCPLFFSSKGAKDNHVKKQHADLFKV